MKLTKYEDHTGMIEEILKLIDNLFTVYFQLKQKCKGTLFVGTIPTKKNLFVGTIPANKDLICLNLLGK